MGRTKCKRIIAVILILCLFVMIFIIVPPKKSTASADADESIVNDFYFNLNNEETGYIVGVKNRQLSQAVIPAHYNGLPVISIEENGFASCLLLKYVYIPNTVIKIGKNAFLHCRSLMSVKGMLGVREIGDAAFADCSSLFNLILPSSIETIGIHAFRQMGVLVDQIIYKTYRQQNKDEKEPGYNLLRQ